MSFLISIVVLLIKQIWPFVIFGLLIGFWATNYFRSTPDLTLKARKRQKRLRNFFQSFVVLLPGVVFLYGSYITNPLINYVGIESTGKVISQVKTSTLRNYQRVFKMNVAYLREDGGVQESSFRTDEFNYYPASNPSTYPRVGQEFKLKYLPYIPRYFVIFNVH